MQWMGARGTLDVGGEGSSALVMRMQAFGRPRRITIRQGERVVLEEVVGEWTELRTDPVERGGPEVLLEAAEGCDRVSDLLPETGDHRCVSVSLADVRVDAP